ncbi:MAG: hypothetical protein OXC80_02940 [Gammaproteobacteria bacterium]|nr:hypothetical protein [Gammaproteobacteria bacterium]
MLAAIPNPEVLLSLVTTQEAVLSTKIEGIQTTVEEALEFDAGRKPEIPARLEDFIEVLNYRSAIRHAEKMLENLPLSGRVVRSTNSVLLTGVRGKGRAPGEFRKIPNWIGCLIVSWRTLDSFLQEQTNSEMPLVHGKSSCMRIFQIF